MHSKFDEYCENLCSFKKGLTIKQISFILEKEIEILENVQTIYNRCKGPICNKKFKIVKLRESLIDNNVVNDGKFSYW